MNYDIEKLAHSLVNYSCSLKKGEKILIHSIGSKTRELALAIVKAVYECGGIPFTWYTDPRVQRELLLGSTKEQLELKMKIDSSLMQEMDAYIGLRGSDNVSELSDVPAEKMSMYEKVYSTPVHHEIRVPKTKWVVLRFPNEAMAQLAGTSTSAFEEFYYDVCNLDYSKMNEAMKSLVGLMNKTDKVKMIGPGTNIEFSIKDIPAVPCAGHMNIPDGEVYTAPIRNSINGTITYNAPSLYQGFVFENVSFTFKDGKIIEATANDTKRLNEILDTDDGARYIGEFAIGVNPYIEKPMKDILFDEKINGSIHFTPGNSYDDASNGNKSAIHWDLVWIQREDYGGGEIYFDDVLIRKDGRFVIPELECLNPENLK